MVGHTHTICDPGNTHQVCDPGHAHVYHEPMNVVWSDRSDPNAWGAQLSQAEDKWWGPLQVDHYELVSATYCLNSHDGLMRSVTSDWLKDHDRLEEAERQAAALVLRAQGFKEPERYLVPMRPGTTNSDVNPVRDMRCDCQACRGQNRLAFTAGHIHLKCSKCKRSSTIAMKNWTAKCPHCGESAGWVDFKPPFPAQALRFSV